MVQGGLISGAVFRSTKLEGDLEGLSEAGEFSTNARRERPTDLTAFGERDQLDVGAVGAVFFNER